MFSNASCNKYEARTNIRNNHEYINISYKIVKYSTKAHTTKNKIKCSITCPTI
uniref:Uncharacterized protein n=1 Tax=Arundo donax TaxID=35708 RepID=A0A0A8YP24_ARUDO